MPRAFVLNLGCSKNRVDSERIAGVLESAGYALTSDAHDAELGVVNTCAFLQSAVRESIDAILDLAEMKSHGMKRVGVVGCLVNRYGDELGQNLPEVDFWARCEDYEAILRSATGAEEARCLPNPERRLSPGSPCHVRYLKIAEGCNNRCAYCAIPGIRGPQRSLPISFLVREAETLVEEGAREICLVSQDLTAYGTESGGGGLIALLDALERALPADTWLRLLYLQPARVDTRLLERVANGRQILPYLDIPIQHASEPVLHAMNRAAGSDRLLDIFQRARAIRPDFALRTTCMVGFPGETRGDFARLLRFLEEAQFDRVGAFLYSPEEGTPAADFPSAVSPRTKRARLERLMSLQEEISLARQSLFVGRELDVLIDAPCGEGVCEGRSYREAPEVDGVIEIRHARDDLRAGDLVRVTVTDAYEHDLLAEEVGV